MQLHAQAPATGLRGTATAADAVSASEPFTLCDRLVLVSDIYHLIWLITGKKKNTKHATFFTLFVPTTDTIPLHVIV